MLQPLAHTTRNDNMGCQKEQNGAEWLFPRRCKVCKYGVKRLTRIERSVDRCNKVIERPTRNDIVEAGNECRYDNAVVAERFPPLRELRIRLYRTFAGGCTDGKLRQHNRNTEYQHAYKIEQHECTSAIFACNIWKSPNTAQADCTTRSNQHGTDLAAKRIVIMLH